MEPQILQEWLKEIDDHEEDTLADILHKEVQKWAHNCVDVEELQRRVVQSEDTCRMLSQKVVILQNQLQKLQLEKMNNYNNQDRLKAVEKTQSDKKLSSNAEDEGISSSERSSSPEDLKHREAPTKNSSMQDNDQETTIDDVIEELRIIVKDAEEQFEDRKQISKLENSLGSKDSRTSSKKSSNVPDIETFVYDNKKGSSLNIEINETQNSADRITRTNTEKVITGNSQSRNSKKDQMTYFGPDKDSDSNTRKPSSQDSSRAPKSSVEGGLKIVIKGPDVEEAIVPAILHPQPPRRTPACLSVMLAVRSGDFVDHEIYNSHDEEIEEETLGDGSDSLLSASRLKYNDGKENLEHFQMNPRVNIDQIKVQEHFEDLRDYDSDGKRERRLVRNVSSSLGSGSKAASDQPGIIGNHLDSYKQFQSIPKQNSIAQKHNLRHRSEVEKRKFLRRSASQDFLESNNSSPRSRRSGSRIEGKIRKFESLNSFDERQSLHNLSRFMEESPR